MVDSLLAVQLRFLLEVADRDAFGRADRAHVVLIHTGHDLQQRALTGTVATQNANLGTRIEGQPNIAQHHPLVVHAGQTFDLQNVLLSHVLTCYHPLLVVITEIAGRATCCETQPLNTKTP